MCQVDQKTEDQLCETINQFLDEGRMFTGYDVTIETRTREGVQMRHKDVRGAIHEMQPLVDACDWGHDNAQGETVKWQKAQVTMPGGGGWAFVYHPEGADPNNYQPRQTGQSQQAASQTQTQSQTPPPTNSPTTATSTNGSDSGGANGDGTFSTDYRNRLFIQTKFVGELGLKKNDTVHVITDADNNRVLLAVDYTTDMETVLGGPSAITQQIERNGDLRLSSKTLRASSLDIAEDFQIEARDLDVNGQTVKVVEVSQAS